MLTPSLPSELCSDTRLELGETFDRDGVCVCVINDVFSNVRPDLAASRMCALTLLSTTYHAGCVTDYLESRERKVGFIENTAMRHRRGDFKAVQTERQRKTKIRSQVERDVGLY